MLVCNQCQEELGLQDRFCENCGAKVDEYASKSSTDKTGADAGPPSTSRFGPPTTRWWLSFKGKGAFPPGYEWLEERSTLLVCQNHLVLLRGDEKRSAALDAISAMGLIGGAVGLLRALKDGAVNKNLELEDEVAQRLFDDKLMVWCRKDDALIWRYHEKPWMFIKSSSEQLYCQFTSAEGTLHACAVLWCSAEYAGFGKGDVDGLGCRFVDAGRNLPEKAVPQAMADSRAALPG